LTGEEYTVEVWEPIVIRLTYTDAISQAFTITTMDNNPPPFEYDPPDYSSNNIVQFNIPRPDLTSTGEYSVRVSGELLNPARSFRIIVNRKPL